MKSYLLSGIVLAALLTGCQDTVNTVENSEKSATITTVDDARYVTDSFLRDRLKLAPPRIAANAGGCMTVDVAATNLRTGFWSEWWSDITGENPYPVSYRFDWQDANGIAVNAPNTGVWKRITIYPGDTVHFKATAPTPQCKDFTLSLREDKK